MKPSYQKQFWCRLMLSIMAFVMPFIAKQAVATSLPETEKISTEKPFDTSHIDVSDNLAVWGVSPQDIGGVQIMAYDFIKHQEVQITHDEKVQYSNPATSGNLIVFYNGVWDAGLKKWTYYLNLCEYNSQNGTCPKVVIDSSSAYYYGQLRINQNKVAWTGKDESTGRNALFYCEYDYAGNCPKVKVHDLFHGEIDSSATFDLNENYLAFNFSTSYSTSSKYLYNFTTHEKSLLLTSNYGVGPIYFNGDKLFWSSQQYQTSVTLHYCDLAPQNPNMCEDHLISDYPSSVLMGVSGNYMFIHDYIVRDLKPLYRVMAQNINDKSIIEISSSLQVIQAIRVFNNKLLWFIEPNLTEPYGPETGMYLYNLENLPGNQSPPTNRYPPIVTAPMIAKLMWDAGFVVKFDVDASDPDGVNIFFTHPTANEIPPTAVFNLQMTGDSSVSGHFDWKPALDVVTGKSGINWSDTAGINWTDTSLFMNFEASDGEFNAKKLSDLRPRYQAYCGNNFCDNGLTQDNKNKLSAAYGINWDDVVPADIRNTFTDRGENISSCPTECAARCGDRIVTAPETCDANSQPCTINGYTGTQTCNSQCNGFNTCVSSQRCGDSIRNGNEVCDGTSKACTTAGGYAGTQACNSSCNGYNTCTSTQRCGDGIKNGTEECDGTSGVGANQKCNAQCQLVTADTTLPVVQIVVPTDQPTFATTADKITLSAIATDNVGVTSVTWKNNANGATGNAVAGYGYVAVDVPLVVGSNTIVYTAQDAAANSGTDTITITRNPMLGPNLVENGDFNPALGKAKWSGWGTNVQLDTTAGKTAPNSLKMILGSTNRDINHMMFNVKPEKTYHISQFVKASFSSQSSTGLDGIIEWRKASGALIKTDTIVSVRLGNALSFKEWLEIPRDLVAPLEAAQMKIIYYGYSGSGSAEVSIDDVTVQEKL